MHQNAQENNVDIL